MAVRVCVRSLVALLALLVGVIGPLLPAGPAATVLAGAPSTPAVATISMTPEGGTIIPSNTSLAMATGTPAPDALSPATSTTISTTILTPTTPSVATSATAITTAPLSATAITTAPLSATAITTAPLSTTTALSLTPGTPASVLGRALAAPLNFERNDGQTDGQVAFLSRGNGYTLFLTPREAVLGLVAPISSTAMTSLPLHRFGWRADALTTAAPLTASVLRLQFAGANPSPQIVGVDQLPGNANYFIGSEPRHWHTDIPTYARVAYRGIYPGTDLVYYGRQGHLEWDWIVAAGASPSAITFSIQGARMVRLDGRGNLMMRTASGLVRQNVPIAYQVAHGVRRAVPIRYVLTRRHHVGLQVGRYDTRHPLVIDPVLVYSTYLGGNGTDQGYGIAVDGAGNAYTVGQTFSTTFPTVNPAQGSNNSGGNGSSDTFIAKMNASGSALSYSTYLGGTGDDNGYAIAVDSAGSAYVGGSTNSTNFPTAHPLQAANGGGADNFITKLSPAGNALVYSTYLGGGGSEGVSGIAVDGAGDAYIAGLTSSSNYPTLNPVQATLGGGTDASVTEINASGSGLVYSTYLGGGGDDRSWGIAVDGAGGTYVVGQTFSTNFPTVNALQGRSASGGNGSTDTFVAKFAPGGGTLSYSTYLGGTGDDNGYAIAVDGAGSAYVAGSTDSSDFPTVHPLQTTYHGNADGFLAKLTPNGGALAYATYLGGGGSEGVQGVAVDGAGNAYLAGLTSSGDFPIVNALQPVDGGGYDVFAAKVSASGSALVYSTYLGGNGDDRANGLALDNSGNVYVTGETSSSNFPTTLNLTQGSNAGGADAFVAKISPATASTTVSGGTTPWHPHQQVRLSQGLSASVDLADGHIDVSASALHLPGRGPDLAMDRTWDSVRAQAGLTTTAGQGWSSSLSPRIGGAITGTLVFTDDTGASWPLTYTGALPGGPTYTAYSPPPGMPWQLTVATALTTAYTLTNFLTGATMSFDNQGRYVATADAYGNKNALPIASNPGPDSITNSGGRSIQISYGSNGLLSEVGSPLWVSGGSAQAGSQHVTYSYAPGTAQLQTITTQAGTGQDLATTFGYNGMQLVTVTVPSGRPWTFAYDGAGRVASVTSPQSGTVTTAPGSTPAYTTRFRYVPLQTQVIAGYDSPHPVTTTYTLDTQGEPLTVNDAQGHTVGATYDADHDVTSRTDANGNLTQYGYQYVGLPGASPALTTTGLLTQTISPPVSSYTTTNSLAPVVTTYAYNPGTYDLAEVDLPQGGRTFYGYDGATHAVITTTQLLKDTPGFGCPQFAQRGPAFNAARAATLSQTCVHAYTWRATVVQRNGVGQVIKRVDARGVDAPQTTSLAPPTAALNASSALYTSSYGYDAQGDLTSASTPPIATTAGVSAPVTTVYTPDADGNITSVRSPNGNVTSDAYDHLGRVTTATAPPVPLADGTTKSPLTTITYDPDGHLSTTSDALGDTYARGYDPLGRVTMLTNPLGRTALYTYTATQLAATQDYAGSVAQRAYDNADRLTSATDTLGIASSYGYDNAGNVTSVTTPLDYAGVQTTSQITHTYDALDRPATDGVVGLGGATPATAQVGSTSYDGDGNVSLRVQTGGGGVTYSQYDLADRLQSTTVYTDQNAGALASDSLTLDNADHPIQSYDFNGRDHNLSFDGADRATQSTDCLYCAGTPPITTTTGYDPDGNAVAVTRTVGTATPVATGALYNADDWLTQRDDGAGPTTFGYDQAGRRSAESLLGGPSQGLLTRSFNAGSLTTALTDVVTDTNPAATTSSTSLFTYTLDDLPLTTTLDNGPTSLTEWRSYDADNRLAGLHVTGPLTASPTLAYDETVGHDPQGHTTGITTTLAGVGYVNNGLYSYTAQGFLLAATSSRAFAGNWDYDGAGNIQAGYNATNNHVTTYKYAPLQGIAYPQHWLPNELLHADLGNGDRRDYQYDPSGATTLIASNGVTKTLAYDGQGQLTALTTTGSVNDNAVAIAYNARGLRARYTVTRAGQGQPSLDERFLYRDTQVGQVAVSGTSITTPFTETFLYRPDGTPLALLYQQPGQRTARYWDVVDGRGSVVALTDASGARVASYSYDAWGAPTGADESGGIHQPLRYRGYWYDGWTDGLGNWNDNGGAMPWYWLGARTYDPVLERFLQPDPASQTGLPDYVYARNDPLDLTDPTGLAGVPAGCASSGYVSQGQHFAACEGAGYAQQRAEQTNAALWAPANFLLLDPARNAFGPGTSLFDRGLGLVALAPFVGWAGHGISLLADVGRSVSAAADVARTAEDTTPLLKGGAQFLGDNAGIDNGAGLGNLADRQINVSEQGLNLVQRHLARPELDVADTWPQNIAMIARLRNALNEGQAISGADASFYLHEASEATMMDRGVPYAEAHAAALAKYGVSPFSVYHPEVIQSLPDYFNSNWYRFWGMEK